jgi:hypothetical protein
LAAVLLADAHSAGTRDVTFSTWWTLLSSLCQRSNLGTIGFSSHLQRCALTSQDLRLGGGFNEPLGVLPEELQRLDIETHAHGEVHGSRFNKDLRPLPPALQFLCVGSAYDYALGQLPGTLKQLFLPQDYARPLQGLPDGCKCEYEYA